MTTALEPAPASSVLQVLRHMLEKMAFPGLEAVNLTEVLEVFQLQAAALASEVLLAERAGTSLTDAVDDARSYPRMARVHTYWADVLTLQLPVELQKWMRELYARPPDAEFIDGLQLALGRLVVSEAVSAAERALARFALFECVRLGLALVEHQTEGQLALLDIGRSHLDSVAEKEVARVVEAVRLHGSELRPLNLALAQAICVLDQNVEVMKRLSATMDQDTALARGRKAQIEKLLLSMDARDAVLMRNLFHEDLEEQRVTVARLKEMHPELLGDLSDDAIYQRVRRLKTRLESGERLGRTEPSLVDLAFEQLKAKGAK